jgi:hypothetical protein
MLLGIVIAVVFCVAGVSLVEVAGLGLSLEHPTAIEQTIKSAAKSSALAVFSKFFLPHVTESQVDAILLTELKLKCAMIGHLLLLSSARESARSGPAGGVLILQELRRCVFGLLWFGKHGVGAWTRIAAPKSPLKARSRSAGSAAPPKGNNPTPPQSGESGLPAALCSRRRS